MKFEGIYTPIVTPYDDNHDINYDAIEAIVDDLINSGVHGLIVAGTTGEYYSCLLYTSPSPRDGLLSRMPSSA